MDTTHPLAEKFREERWIDGPIEGLAEGLILHLGFDRSRSACMCGIWVDRILEPKPKRAIADVGLGQGLDAHTPHDRKQSSEGVCMHMSTCFSSLCFAFVLLLIAVTPSQLPVTHPPTCPPLPAQERMLTWAAPT